MNKVIQLSDSELMRSLRDGSESAYLALYDRYNTVLFRHAYQKLGNFDDAHDVIQDFFIHLWEKRRSISCPDNVAGYFFVAIRHRVLNVLYARQRDQTHLDALAAFTEHFQSSTELTLRDRELQAIVDEELNALPPRMREVFILSRMGGLTHREISEKLGTSEQTIAKQITKVLKVLRVKLGPLLGVLSMIASRFFSL